MKRYISCLYIIPLLVSCQETTKAEVGDEVISENMVSNTKYQGEEPKKPEETELYQPVPPKVVVDENGVPSDAIVLFDGTSLDNWIHVADSSAATWHLNDDSSMTVKDKTGSIQTKQNFGSVQLHIEWKSPAEIAGEGQSRANSGIFLQNRYEVQVLDNNENDTYVNDK